jgi:hypothetical protein
MEDPRTTAIVKNRERVVNRKKMQFRPNEAVTEYLAKIDQLEGYEAPGEPEPPRRFQEGDYLYRWDKRDGLHLPGGGGLEGSSWWQDGPFLSPLVNPSFGDDTIFASGSPDGARGFLDGEMKRSYVKKIRNTLELNADDAGNRVTPDETWNLYKIYPTADQFADLIDFREFRNPETEQTVKAHPKLPNVPARRVPLNTPPRTDGERMQYLTNIPLTYEGKINMGGLNRRMSPEVHTRFMKYMTTPSAANFTPFMNRRGRRFYHDVRQELGWHMPRVSREGLVDASTIDPSDPLTTTSQLHRLDRAFAYVLKDEGAMDNRLDVIFRAGPQTDEVQIPGPMAPNQIEKVGSHTFKHNELVGEVDKLFKQATRSDPLVLPRGFIDDPHVTQLLEDAELAEADV